MIVIYEDLLMLVVLQLSPSGVSLNYLQRNLNIVHQVGLEPTTISS